MIAVCIPVYNHPIAPLAGELRRQIARLDRGLELVVIDDGSEDRFREANREACREARYVELTENIGRSRIRNLFLFHTQCPYLLFLDCDSLLVSRDFLKDYLEMASQSYPVVCGGRIYPAERPPREKRLRWEYGVRRESQPAETRRRHPHRSFLSNNFMVHRSVLERIPFDERLTGYGHEDTLFGFMLGRHNIPVMHTNNPVLNDGLETNREFLEKTQQGVLNLIHITRLTDNQRELTEGIALLRLARRIGWASPAIRGIFFLLKPPLARLLSAGLASMSLFGFFKLGLYMESRHQMKKQRQ
jgi:GT2 family glycosyltransferase